MNLKNAFLLLLALLSGLKGMAQNPDRVGTYDPVTQKASLSVDESVIRAKFVERLGAGVEVSEIELIGREVDGKNKYLVTGKVRNHASGMSAFGLELVRNGNEIVYARSGGGFIEHMCVGDPCQSCKQEIDWRLAVYCTCIRCNGCDPAGGRCNHSMTVKL